MEERAMPQKAPYVIDLVPGTYYWCRCGHSQKQPFCDGSHKGTGFTPMKTEVSEARRVALCGCKRTGNEPTCDGSHKNL